MTQVMLVEEAKRVCDPEAIDAPYSYTLAAGEPHSWSDIVPIEAKSGRSTQEMTDWVRS